MKRKTRIRILLGFTILALLVTFLLPQIPQPEEYYDFADQRTILGIPNALDVLSNLAFLIVGALGMWRVTRGGKDRKPSWLDEREKWPWFLLFAGTFFTAFGSAYFHWSPSHETLFWDRLPMTFVAMSLLAAVLCERVSVAAGLRWLPLLLILGGFSVVWWIWTEQRGTGDLRPYGVVQFVPMLLIPLLILLFPRRYSHTGGYFGALAWYLLAKGSEAADGAIFGVGGLISGHTLKHIFAALAFLWLLRMLLRREPDQALLPSSLTPKKRRRR